MADVLLQDLWFHHGRRGAGLQTVLERVAVMLAGRAGSRLAHALAAKVSRSRSVRVLRQGELAAVVSDAPDQLRPKRRDLLAHHRVLHEAGAGGVVLPMRFGSASPDDDMVTRVLAERAGHFLERLGALGSTTSRPTTTKRTRST